ncbi:uncharacterized protein BDZ99DRAFT_191738 [Mytilinidion resinicola]|uniref:Transmembrane protein n=1 Tax=Mytilinidion resinicola TaxID=574789 RepID=A0A6A6Z364_9PEZI|nr:uncharacterized protein BDZ99DRAFT_191738 [Mytilinidion resinicola]KAF2815169.1 hypothetical protein BDZ99DRAFT_191738 [Mytilinidion resinicola]
MQQVQDHSHPVFENDEASSVFEDHEISPAGSIFDENELESPSREPPPTPPNRFHSGNEEVRDSNAIGDSFQEIEDMSDKRNDPWVPLTPYRAPPAEVREAPCGEELEETIEVLYDGEPEKIIEVPHKEESRETSDVNEKDKIVSPSCTPPPPRSANAGLSRLPLPLRLFARLIAGLKVILRPRVKLGYERLEWTCSCGEAMYGDYKCDDIHALEFFRRQLRIEHLSQVSVKEYHMSLQTVKRGLWQYTGSLETGTVVATVPATKLEKAKTSAYEELTENTWPRLEESTATRGSYAPPDLDAGQKLDVGWINETLHHWFKALEKHKPDGSELDRERKERDHDRTMPSLVGVTLQDGPSAINNTVSLPASSGSTGVSSQQQNPGQTLGGPGYSNSSTQNVYPLPQDINFNDPGNTQTTYRFFELCVNTGTLRITLGEIPLTSRTTNGITEVQTDSAFFALVHARYHSLRRSRRFGFLFKPVDIQFVRFGVVDSHRVGVYDKPMAIPPHQKVKEQHYHYRECPLDPLPPIDYRTFFHYFWNHEQHAGSQSRLFFDRMPKKLHSSILKQSVPNELTLGWGVHIIEGPNKPLLSLCLCVILVLSFVVSVVVALAMKTQESGFGIGQWMVATLSAALAAVYYHLAES